MKPSITAAGLTTVFCLAGLVYADVVPPSPAFARYEAMKERSPFAVATAVAVPAATPNFAKDLYIANAARTPQGDLITLASTTDKSFKEYLTTNEPVNGYKIESVEWSDRVGETKVTISKDGQTATLAFNQALLSQTGPGGPGMQPPPSQPQPVPAVPQFNQGAVPGVPGVNNPQSALQSGPIVTPQMPPAGLPTPPPRVRGVIPRNPTPSIVQPPPLPPQPDPVDPAKEEAAEQPAQPMTEER